MARRQLAPSARAKAAKPTWESHNRRSKVQRQYTNFVTPVIEYADDAAFRDWYVADEEGWTRAS